MICQEVYSAEFNACVVGAVVISVAVSCCWGVYTSRRWRKKVQDLEEIAKMQKALTGSQQKTIGSLERELGLKEKVFSAVGGGKAVKFNS